MVRIAFDKELVLSGHFLLRHLGRDELRRLAAATTLTHHPARTVIFQKGDPGSSMMAVIRGKVKICTQSIDGKELVLNLINRGGLFGEIALLDGEPRTADAVTMADCEFTVIERRDFLTFVHSEPKVALKLIELLCARLRWASLHFEEVVFLTLPTRLARTLLRLSQDKKAKEGKLAITQRELSHMLGTTRESVNKQLRAWAKVKWIALERGGVSVLAPDELGEVAKGGDKSAEKRVEKQ
jgi:CRP-like cAMP-binding protein